jgi:hypothetical protein
VQGPRHVIQRLPRPSAYQQVKLRQSWSPVLWKTSGVGTDASVRAGWLDRPRSASRCKLISVLPRDFSGQHLLRLRPVVMEVIHLAWDHRASRGSAARTLLSRRLHVAYFVQRPIPVLCHCCARPRPRSAPSINTTAALHVQDVFLEALAHPDSLTPASIGLELARSVSKLAKARLIALAHAIQQHPISTSRA